MFLQPWGLSFEMDFWVGFNLNFTKFLLIFDLNQNFLTGVLLYFSLGGVLFKIRVQITLIGY